MAITGWSISPKRRGARGASFGGRPPGSPGHRGGPNGLRGLLRDGSDPGRRCPDGVFLTPSLLCGSGLLLPALYFLVTMSWHPAPAASPRLSGEKRPVPKAGAFLVSGAHF